VPRVTAVFWNAMLSRSPSGTSSSASGSVALPIGALSPVSAASCVSIVAVRTRRPSAGTMSPASSSTTSPGTSWLAGICTSTPSRTTLLVGFCMVASASTLLRACSSWRVPMTTLTSTRNATIAAVDPCPIATLTTATATSMRFIGSRSCSSSTAHTDGGACAVSVLGPYCRCRLPTSAPSSPCSGLVPSARATSTEDSAHHRVSFPGAPGGAATACDDED